MSVAFPFHILQEHPPKPTFGAPCNNCGLCCRLQACHVSENFLNSSQAPCIALEVHNGVYQCGMILRPSHYLGLSHLDGADEMIRPLIAEALDIGRGCTMDDVVLAVRT